MTQHAHRRLAIATAAAIAAVTAFLPQAHAANGTWIAGDPPEGTDFLWSDPANWLNGVIPGSTAGAAGNSTDVAFVTADTAITVDPNRNIGGITIDVPSGDGPAVGENGGNALYLSPGAVIQVTAASNTATNPAVNAPVVLLGNATFAAHSPNSSAGLKPNGNVTTAAPSGTVTLTLAGANASGVLTSNSQFLGAISDGPTAKISLVKEGVGVWDLRATADNPNTYTGPTILNAGGIRINGAGAVPTNADYVINGNSSLRFSVSNLTARSVTVNTAVGYTANTGAVSSPFSGSNAGVILNLANTTGPALTIDMAAGPTPAADPTLSTTLNLTGAVANQGGLRMVSGPAGFRVTLNRVIDLGAVNRTFEVADTPGVSTDLRMNAAITGAAGLTKTGAGTLKIEIAPTYSGNTTVQQGRILASPAATNFFLTGSNATILTGGVLAFDYAPSDTVTPPNPYTSAVAAVQAERVRINPNPGTASMTQTVAVVDDADSFIVSLQRAYYGDTDTDGVLDGDDLARIDRARAMNLPASWSTGDVNYDNVINANDLFLVDRAFGLLYPASPDFAALLDSRRAEFGDAYVSHLLTAVPEPSTLLALTTLPLLTPRRRRPS